MKKSSLSLLSCTVALAAWGAAQEPAQKNMAAGTLEPAKIQAEQGFCYIHPLGSNTLGDGVKGGPPSALQLFEDGKRLGPARAPHAVIRSNGRGAHSHWVTALYFSASDNSDPRKNGRAYTWSIPMPLPSNLAPPAAQIGNLWPFIQRQTDRAPMDWSYLHGRYGYDVEKWKKEVRGKFIELLHYDPPRCAPDAKVLERVEAAEHVREKIEFNTAPGVRVPAYVLIPRDGKEKHPGLVALHDHGAFFVWGKEKLIALPGEHQALTNFRKQYYGERAVANELVKRGYVVLVIDAFYWGERRLRMQADPPSWADRERMSLDEITAANRQASLSVPAVGNGVFESGITWAGVMFTDDLRSVDYLASRPEVDSNRMGCLGLSMGGFRTVHLAGLHPALKAAVCVGWMSSYPMMLQNHLTTISFWATVPGLQQHMDLPDVVSMHAPGGHMVIMGTKDPLFPVPGIKTAYDKIAQSYQKAKIADRFEGVLYEGPHEFNVEQQNRA